MKLANQFYQFNGGHCIYWIFSSSTDALFSMSERELCPRVDSAASSITKKLSKRMASKQAAEQSADKNDDQLSVQTPTPSKMPKKLVQFFAGESGKSKTPGSSKIKLGVLTFKTGPGLLSNE